MSTNNYFNHTSIRTEQDLINQLTQESIKLVGIDINYMPRSLVNEDKLFGEDLLNQFSTSHVIEMQIASVDSFGGGGDIVSQFGYQVKDEIDLIVSRERFQLVTGMDKPLEGDLIYLPLSNGLFEINFVEDENPFYQAGKLYQFNLKCELFVYNQETMDTGVPEIDATETLYTNDDDSSNDLFADNARIETEADTILDFSETNPFGEV